MCCLTFPTRVNQSFLSLGHFFLQFFSLNFINLKHATFIEKVIVASINLQNLTFKIVSSFHISNALKKDLDEVPNHENFKQMKSEREREICLQEHNNVH
jgi:hypothetical protein